MATSKAVPESELIEQARRGDREAFARLYAPLERPLAAFLYRMIAARQDAEDLAQDAALRALETISEIENGTRFRAWLFRMAARLAMQYLGERKQWDPDAQIRAGKRLAEASTARQLKKLHDSRLGTRYSLAEHVDFCFTALGRSLPPHELAALLLLEIHGLPVAEAAEILEVPGQVLEFRLRQVRETLNELLEPRCKLINRGGTCDQCAGLDTFFHKDLAQTERNLFDIPLRQQATAEERAATLDQRLAIIRDIDPLRAEGAKLHEVLMDLVQRAGS